MCLWPDFAIQKRFVGSNVLTSMLIIFTLLVLASACNNPTSRLDEEAGICERALEISELEIAEEA